MGWSEGEAGTPNTIQTTNYYSNRKCELVSIYIMWVDKGQDECGRQGRMVGGEAGTPKTTQMTNYYSNHKCESVGIYIMGVDMEQDEHSGWWAGRWSGGEAGTPNTIQTM